MEMTWKVIICIICICFAAEKVCKTELHTAMTAAEENLFAWLLHPIS